MLQAQSVAMLILNFAEKNPGMTRVMIGDALINEDARLQLRMNQFFDRIELAVETKHENCGDTGTIQRRKHQFEKQFDDELSDRPFVPFCQNPVQTESD